MGGRLLFVTWDGGGNVPPVLGLAPQLVAAGHDVRVLGSASLAERFAAIGLPFVPRDPGRAWDPGTTAADVVAECERQPTDAVVVDYMLPTALCGARAAGVPAAALVHTLYTALLADGAPNPISMAASLDAVAGVRADLGLPPVASFGELLDEGQVIVTSPRALDVDEPRASANITYVGPVLEPPGDDAGWAPPPGADPLVVVSLGTTPMDEVPVLQATLDALAPEAVRVLATVGAHVDPATLSVPANATVCGFVRHTAVLPHADAVVCHGGLGTVLAALAHAVPLVCVPLGREQPENADAVARVGAGRTAATDGSDMAAAVLDVLGEPTYRHAAAALAADIAATTRAGAAVAAVESLLR